MNEIKLSGRIKGSTNRMMTGRRLYTVEFASGEEELDVFLDDHQEDLLHFDIRPAKRERLRSLSANAYAWALITEIARATRLTKVEVYREEIRKIGTGDTLQLSPEAVPAFERRWKKNGLGWIVERIGPCRIVDERTGEVEEKEEVLAIYGSSTFDPKEMSQFIDAIIQDCKAIGIPVLSDAEIALLKEEWT